MGAITLARTILYLVALVFSVLAFIISAAATGKKWGYYYGYDLFGGGYRYATTTLTIWVGILIFGIVATIYFVISLVFARWNKKSHAVNWVLTDIIALSVLFLFGLIATAYATSRGGGLIGIGAASVAFGWLATFTILGTLVLVIAWTFMKHGTSVETLKNSLSELEERSVQKNVEAGVAAAPQEAPAIKTEAEADAPPQPTQ